MMIFVFQALQDHIVFVNRPIDKKQVVFYNDKYCRFTVDEGNILFWSHDIWYLLDHIIERMLVHPGLEPPNFNYPDIELFW